MERIVRFESGHNCRDFKCKFNSKNCAPGSGGYHGIHGLQIRFILKGSDGAVQFLLYTDWIPKHCKPNAIHVRDCVWSEGKFTVMPADLGWHSKAPRYDGQEITDESCEFCDNHPCYYDGSGLNANDAMYALVNAGEDGLWKFLEEYYATVFNDGPYPQPSEYGSKLR